MYSPYLEFTPSASVFRVDVTITGLGDGSSRLLRNAWEFMSHYAVQTFHVTVCLVATLSLAGSCVV